MNIGQKIKEFSQFYKYIDDEDFNKLINKY